MYNIYIMYVPDVVIFPLLTLIPRRSPLIFFCRQNRVLDAELLALSHHDVVGDAWQEVEKLWARHVVRIDELFWKLPASPQHDQVPGEKGSKYNEGLDFITREIDSKRDFSGFSRCNILLDQPIPTEWEWGTTQERRPWAQPPWSTTWTAPKSW